MPANIMTRGYCQKVSGKSCVTPGQTKITRVVNFQTKQLHRMTTPNRTITSYDNTKPNNYIVWQHQTKQLHCVTTCKNMILWQEDTAKNNVSSTGGESCVRGEDEKVVSGKSCVTPGQTKITQVVNYETKQLHCMTTPNRTITLCDNTKPNNYILWQHQTEQLHCVTTPNRTITLCDNM